MLDDWLLDCLKCLEQPKLNLWEWADKYRILPKETSAEAGRWSTDRVPYMREPMEKIGDKTTQQVTMMCSAQVGKTEAITNFILRTVDSEPRSMLVIQPTVDMAEMYSEEKLTPAIKATPKLRGKFFEDKSRDKKNTKLVKTFDGGFLVFIGANAAAPLAGRSVGVVLADEIDRYPASAGKEGDPLTLATKRAISFFDKKIIMMSTPTLKNASRIEQLFEQGSKAEWALPCPHCGEYQPLEFDNFLVESAEMYCKSCGVYANEFEWKEGLLNGKWIHEYPERKNKSYHLNAFTSPWVRWTEIAEEWQLAKGNEALMIVFYNTTLGLPYETAGDVGDPRKLYDLRENYTAIPDEVEYLSCGVDTQDDRLEYEIKGWGKEEENWGIEKGVILGRPNDRKVWDTLELKISKSFVKENGKDFLMIAMTFVDSGGHYTDEVYQNCSKLRSKGYRIFPIKGVGKDSTPVFAKFTKLERYKTTLIQIGVNGIKEKILQMCNPESDYFRAHYTKDITKGYNLEYFNQLFAEKKVEKMVGGVACFTWESIRKRNEALDCFVYAYAAYVAIPKNN